MSMIVLFSSVFHIVSFLISPSFYPFICSQVHWWDLSTRETSLWFLTFPTSRSFPESVIFPEVGSPILCSEEQILGCPDSQSRGWEEIGVMASHSALGNGFFLLLRMVPPGIHWCREPLGSTVAEIKLPIFCREKKGIRKDLTAFVEVTLGCNNKTPWQAEGLTQQKFICSQSWRLEVWDQGASNAGSCGWEGALPGCWQWSSHGVLTWRSWRGW